MISRFSLAVATTLVAAMSGAAAPPPQTNQQPLRPGSAASRDVIKAVRRTWVAPPAGTAREGEVIVTYQDGVDSRAGERLLRDGGAREVRRGRSGRRVLVTLQPGVTVAEAVAAFSRLPGVRSAEPNGIVRKSQGTTFKPNDRYYQYQWNLAQMNAERTWGIQKGQPAVAVAVLDTGVAYEDYDGLTGLGAGDTRRRVHYAKAPDWGDTVFLPGHDFVNDDEHPNDDDGHGTHVASTIAEATNNDLGMAGLAFGCAILPVKILDATGSGTDFDVAEGIDFAANYSNAGQSPVKVINLSLGGPDVSDTVQASVNSAFEKGITVVAAAGNAATNEVDFPARARNVLAIGALDERKERAPYSNTGGDLEFMAPGGNCDRDDDFDGVPDCIFQQTLDPDGLDQGRYDQFCYCGLDGTSMATPHAAAAAALLYSQGFTDPASVRSVLEQTAEHLGSGTGRNDTYGFGLLRPANALPGLGLDTGPKQ